MHIAAHIHVVEGGKQLSCIYFNWNISDFGIESRACPGLVRTCLVRIGIATFSRSENAEHT